MDLRGEEMAVRDIDVGERFDTKSALRERSCRVEGVFVALDMKEDAGYRNFLYYWALNLYKSLESGRKVMMTCLSE